MALKATPSSASIISLLRPITLRKRTKIVFVLIDRYYDSIQDVYYTDAEIDEYGLSLEYNKYAHTQNHIGYYEWLVEFKGFRKLTNQEWGEN